MIDGHFYVIDQRLEDLAEDCPRTGFLTDEEAWDWAIRWLEPLTDEWEIRQYVSTRVASVR